MNEQDKARLKEQLIRDIAIEISQLEKEEELKKGAAAS